VDVLERTLYNGFLAGVGLNGTDFFYPNPLSSDGSYDFNKGAATRQPWFHCSCCPSNVVRLIPSLPGYIFAHKDKAIYINLFIASEASIELDNQVVDITINTSMPWDGDVKIQVKPEFPHTFTLKIRIPGWVQNQVVPSNLYRYLRKVDIPIDWNLNNERIVPEFVNGYAEITRQWQTGDTITVDFPMPVRRIVGHPNLQNIRNSAALERGPFVYCVEGVDHHVSVFDLKLHDDTQLEVVNRADLLNGMRVITGDASANGNPVTLHAVPYYAWSHRGVGEMAVWLKRNIS
jgi:DUF1680 family protein